MVQSGRGIITMGKLLDIDESLFRFTITLIPSVATRQHQRPYIREMMHSALNL